MSAPTNPRRVLAPLGTCPSEWLLYYRGDCLSCRGAMASKRVMAIRPWLAEWFYRQCGELCSTCYGRTRDRTLHEDRVQSDYVHRVRPEDLPRLRAMVGACVGCGWTRDAGRHPKTCPTMAEECAECGWAPDDGPHPKTCPTMAEECA